MLSTRRARIRDLADRIPPGSIRVATPTQNMVCKASPSALILG